MSQFACVCVCVCVCVCLCVWYALFFNDVSKDDDARFCELLNDRLFLALDEFDFKVGREYDFDDD